MSLCITGVYSSVASSIARNYEITKILSRNLAGVCHCITFSDSGRVPGTTEEDPLSPSVLTNQSSIINMLLNGTNTCSYELCPGGGGGAPDGNK